MNEQATYQGVLNAFAMLRDKVTPGDTVLVYYSGDSLPEHWESCLEFFDTSYPFRNEATNALSARDLHMFMDSLPTSRKTLAGVMPNGRLFSLAQERRRYALFTRASLGQQDWNYTFDDGVRTSVFVHSFFRHLSQETTTVEETTYGDVIASMQAEAKTTNLNQMPLFLGDPNRLLFSGTSTDLALFDILERTNYAALPSSIIRREYDALEQMDIAFPQAYRSFGKAFLAKGAFPEALSALEKAQVQNPAEPSSVLDLALAHLGENQIQPAINHLTHHLAKVEPSAIDGQIKQLCDDLRTWMKQTPIVLVGIDRYATDNLPTLQGAENDVLAMKQLLITRYGYREEEITVLLNEDATHAAITAAFARVVEKSKATFGLFYFAGIGSETPDNRPTIVSHDGRQSGIYDIILTDLANQVASIHNRLLTIMDAGWTAQRNAPSSHRTIAADHRPPITERAFKLTKASNETHKLAQLALPIGQVSIYNSSLDKYALESPLEQQFTEDLFTNNGENKARIHGSMTYQLLQRLAAAEPASFSFADFIARTPDQPTTVEGTSPSKVNSAQVPSQLTLSTSDKLHPHGNSWFVMPRLSDELLRTPVFADTNQHSFVERLDTLMRVDQTNEMVAILKRMIEQRKDSYPEGHFYLGVAHLVRKEYTEAIDALEKAITQQLGSFDAAHYYLGRTLFESEIDLARAESELRLATQQNDANTLAYYYLGQTIRKRIEQESLVEAQRALEIYLIRGAPLGMRNEVETFLQQGLENR